MNDALYIAATGMKTQQLAVDTIANNLANSSTPGFKSGRVNFQELMYRDAAVNGGAVAEAAANGAALPASAIDQGSGVAVASLLKNFAAAEVTNTANPLDLAVKGEGFLEVQAADGTTAYWRGGRLQVTAEGWLATSQGELLKPQIRVDKTPGSFSVAADGRVSVQKDGAKEIEVGRLPMHLFANPSGLRPLGGGLYQPTERSGDATPAHAGEAGAGTFVQAGSEQSNVNPVDEIVNLMMAQRAYEMSVKVIQAADEMTGMSNNLRK